MEDETTLRTTFMFLSPVVERDEDDSSLLQNLLGRLEIM